MMDRAEISRILSDVGLSETNYGTFDGRWVDEGVERIVSHSPVDGSEIAGVFATSTETYEHVIRKSVEAFNRWSLMPPPERGILVREIGNALRLSKEKLGRLVSLEVGKTKSEGEGEIQEMIDVADFAVGLSRQLYGLTIASERPNHRMYEQWVPLGPIGVISSFNFPCSVWSWNSFIAAVAGDTIVWKPSSKAPLTAIAVMKVVEQVVERLGYPQIFSLVTGSGGTIGELVSGDRRIKLVSFTGSIPSGKHISRVVSERLGRTILELGGNNAAIVSSRSDMDIALKGVAFGALATAGQRCTSTRRAIVDSAIYDSFVERLIRAYSSARVGSPFNEGVLVGPLIDDKAVENFLNAIEQARSEGGKILFGGSRASIKGHENGHYVIPAVIEARKGMKIDKVETFAPILYIYRYNTIEEALEIHNSVPQGLSSSIFSNDIREVEYFLSARGSDCGIANINTGTAGAEIGGAFGGEKETGGGRESGSDSWKSYMRRQTVTINYGRDLPLSQGVRFDI
ncbi:MAG: aldehyde dehydrogenase family protein [Candidatus Thermoplasmatota archaeon]|jgi:aldehyde dehydrogenase (NAD+)|nr:aldehyde dehydrogenase family protein [Candidatus Thermoplasmatota archaeon]MCL5793651.1 aldehyde dehydrogenase family protein [Candidatus Thermoplasmatota archaeon]